MQEFLIQNIAPIMFGFMVLMLAIGYPVAFTLAAHGLIFGALGIWLDLLSPQIYLSLPDRIFAVMSNETLLAIPFFTFMGLILERSGMAEDLLETIGQLFGSVRGGLAYAVIFVGSLLAATTGVVAASVISMSLISIPIMMRYGYNHRIAAGVVAASGTLAQIIPPSLVLIVMADQLGKSVGDMYSGAILPSLGLLSLYVLYILGVSIISPAKVPAIPVAERVTYDLYGYSKALLTLAPPLFLVFLVLGTIFIGVATPTEGGAMGAMGALAIAYARKRLNLSLLSQAMHSTAKLTCFVIFILIGARVFSLTFYAVDGHVWVEHLLSALPGGRIGFLLFVNLLIFLLAFFLDFFELAFIVIPLLVPVANALGIDLVWFGVMISINLQTSFMHPPFGFSLFFLRSAAPKELRTTDIYYGAIPFVLLQLAMVAILMLAPELAMSGKAPVEVLAPSAVDKMLEELGD